MTRLAPAHRGYEYQDLLVAARLVDVMLGSIGEIHVDEKLVADDVFDDLTTVDGTGLRHRIQIKHTDTATQPLSLATFTGNARGLRLDRIIAAALADRERSGTQGTKSSFRIVLPDAPPSDERLTAVLETAEPDPGPFLPRMHSVRMRFRPDVLWGTGAADASSSFSFIREGEGATSPLDLEWVCERLVVEVSAPSASWDLQAPGPAERLLLERVRTDVGAEMYPNADRSAVDVAEALIGAARAARQGSLIPTPPELLRRARLRSDFGAVARAHPVDVRIEVARPATVAKLVRQATAAADEGRIILLVAPPGQGKSWTCHQLLNALAKHDWLIAEHYCYLGEADGDRLPRVRTESVFGSLIGRIAQDDPEAVSRQRPRFAADEQSLERAIAASLERHPDRRFALVVDGIDHVTRVIAASPSADPSFTLADALATLPLPPRSALIVLSQPGTHLQPLKDSGAVTLEVPPLTDTELRQLAGRLGVFGHLQDATPFSERSSPPQSDPAEEFVSTLSRLSQGNALYATYLCREALRTPATITCPSDTLRSLPPFDGSLRKYYEHVQSSLGDQGAWVADVIALLDFPVSRTELKQIRPDMGHRVDAALEVLRPVLLERVTEAGVRIYHESFARFLRLPFQADSTARTALLQRVIHWLQRRGIFNDLRVFRHLLPLLSEADRNEEVVAAVGHDFVVNAIAAGFPASAIIENLATAVRSAVSIGNWPAMVTYVEMSRSAQTYQEERFESEVVGSAELIASLLGPDSLAANLLHNGRPVMTGRAGIQMCAALDKLGAVPPWREYMLAFLETDDQTIYGDESDQAVGLAFLRGRLRLSSSGDATNTGETILRPFAIVDQDRDRRLYAPVDWDQLARHLEDARLPAIDAVRAILDTRGLRAVLELVKSVNSPGVYCLSLAEEILSGRAPDSHGDARYWARRATRSGLPHGNLRRLLALGVDGTEFHAERYTKGQQRLLALTREVQDGNIMYEGTDRVAEWLDRCVVAAESDPVALSSAEALLHGPGWYTCWLRFTVGLAAAEAGPKVERAHGALNALRILGEVDNPFEGQPRACDLHPILDLIEETVRHAVLMLDDASWTAAMQVLDEVSGSVSTSLQGAMLGPVRRDMLLGLAVDTATPPRRAAARRLVEEEFANRSAGRYYADLAGYRLIAARLAVDGDDAAQARQDWTDACRLLTAYGWRKDITIYELLEPLPAMIAAEGSRARTAISRLQPLCERVPHHTDGRETRHAPERWWQLLAKADPCSLSEMIQPRLLGSCNDPNWLLHEARSHLWRSWHHRADPIVSGALRLTLDEPLDSTDVSAFRRLAHISDGSARDVPSRLLRALLCRADERAFDCDTKEDDIRRQDAELVDALNVIARRGRAPTIAPLPTAPLEHVGRRAPAHRQREPTRLPPPLGPFDMMFHPGMLGVAQAIRAWKRRERHRGRFVSDLSRFVNALGYRIVELLEAGRRLDAETALRLIAEGSGFDESPRLLKLVAQGLERHGQRSLATVAYTLTWTRARGRGGWMTFGGETEIQALQRATKLDRIVALQTIGREVEHVVSQGHGTNGIAQALIYGFMDGGLGDSAFGPFEIWDAAFAAISNRIPRVAPTDDPEDVYVPRDTDKGREFTCRLDAAFAAATLAALAHAGREQKRRALVVTQFLIEARPSALAPALAIGLSSLSDPATLTWLLETIDSEGEGARVITSACRHALMDLSQRPHLTVRALARRLLARDDTPWPPSADPDPELLDRGGGLLIPANVAKNRYGTSPLDGMINSVAGDRLSRGELLLPGLAQAVRRRVDAALQTDDNQRRMRAQLNAYGESSTQRWPDAFMASDEAVEDSIQRVASGARAARLINGETLADPMSLEDSLARLLVSDPELPMAVERTRHPRPEIPPPPSRGDSLWSALRTRAQGGRDSVMDVETARIQGTLLLGTTAILEVDAVPTIDDGPHDGWRLIASFERQAIPNDSSRDREDDVVKRYRVIELRPNGDRTLLDRPPVAMTDLKSWNPSAGSCRAVNFGICTQMVIRLDSTASAVGDGHRGLGTHNDLLIPTTWLVTALSLKQNTDFVLDDEQGPAVGVISWRTEYDTKEYSLSWPRLCGTGIVVRSDALDTLVHVANGQLAFRDFLTGDLSLCD